MFEEFKKFATVDLVVFEQMWSGILDEFKNKDIQGEIARIDGDINDLRNHLKSLVSLELEGSP